MYIRGNSRKRTVKAILKWTGIVALYVVLAAYAVPAYTNVKAFMSENLVIQTKVIIIGEAAVTVEVADTDDLRHRGLSGREGLAPGSGMFFVFEKPDFHGIWMKEMKFPIDILWFDQYGEVVDFEESVAPETFPETFRPKEPSLYVLEVPAGFVQEHDIETGDKIDFY